MKTPFFAQEITHFVIFSAWRSHLNLIANMERSEDVRGLLDEYGLDHSDCIGSYQEAAQERPTQEVSHIVAINDESEIYSCAALADIHEQDCILIVGDDLQATLRFADGATQPLGRFIAVSQSEAQASESYTYWNGTYYVCKK